jgi:hypothetical protein
MRKGGTLLFLTAGGMELSWLYAWANFLTISILDRSFPFPETLTCFGLAVAATFISHGRGWRIIWVLGLHIFGFLFAASRIVYAFNSFPSSFWSKSWLLEFCNQSRSPLEWVALVIILVWSILLWTGGIALIRKPLAYARVCSRFDFGLVAFFLLILIKLVPLVNEGIRLNDPTTELLLFPFFIFSLLAMGLARNRGGGARDFLPGYRGVGIILTFTAAVLLFSTGLVLFCLPYLTLTAKAGSAVLKIAAKPLLYLFLAIIRFMFARGITRPEEPPPPAGGSGQGLAAPIESTWWTELLEKALVWGLWGVAGLAAVVMVCLGLFYLLRWLLSRTSKGKQRHLQWHILSGWVERLRATLGFLWREAVRIVHGYTRAAQLYAVLLRWGRRSGLSPSASETPREYGFRLKDHFPRLEKEIEAIVETFHLEVYGGVTLRIEQLAEARLAWRRLRSPLHWPSRLKTWFHQPHIVPSGS